MAMVLATVNETPVHSLIDVGRHTQGRTVMKLQFHPSATNVPDKQGSEAEGPVTVVLTRDAVALGPGMVTHHEAGRLHCCS